MIRRLALGLVVLGTLLAPAGAVESTGTTFVVTETEDSADGACDGHCSLREAIIAANASPGLDAVSVPAGLYGLTLGQALNINDSLKLIGAGAGSTLIDGGGEDAAILALVYDSEISVSGVTLQNGGDGAVYNRANMTISDSVIRDSHPFPGVVSGGGIVNDHALILSGTTLTGNSATYGGALDLDSSSNTLIINSTISGNLAQTGGAAIMADGALTVLNSTIANNTGPVFSGFTTERPLVLNSILAGNGPANCGFKIPVGDHNLDSDGSCGFSGPSDVSNADPLLGMLADNGGPTPTHALLLGSPAIDAGAHSLCVVADQRGVSRAGASCDLGAYEAPVNLLPGEPARTAAGLVAVAGLTFVVTKTTDSADGACNETDCSLREAIIAANHTPGPDTVTVPAGVYQLTIPRFTDPDEAGGDLNITDDLMLTGAGAKSTIIDGGGSDGILRTPNAKIAVRVSGLTMRANVDSYSSAVFNDADAFFTLHEVVIENYTMHISSFYGGGIFNAGTLVLNRSAVSGNTGALGGGMMLDPESLTLVTNSTISGNSGFADVAIWASGELTLINSTIARNGGTGLALSYTGHPIIVNTVIADNSPENCQGHPGAFYSLDTDGTCGLTGEGDRSFAQAMLAPLGDYGGPTPTHALSPGGCMGDACVFPSEAINAGSNAYCLMVDQRGAPRPLLDTCDMGAYEFGDKDAERDPGHHRQLPGRPQSGADR